MKSAKQVREFVRRRWRQEGFKSINGNHPDARGKKEAFLEVLTAFDTPHKTKLKMPRTIK